MSKSYRNTKCSSQNVRNLFFRLDVFLIKYYMCTKYFDKSNKVILITIDSFITSSSIIGLCRLMKCSIDVFRKIFN